jgi:hypothetical protein
VWWTQNPLALILCVAAALATFFWITTDNLAASGDGLAGRPGSRGLIRGRTYRAAQFSGSTSIDAISQQEKMHVAD